MQLGSGVRWGRTRICQYMNVAARYPHVVNMGLLAFDIHVGFVGCGWRATVIIGFRDKQNQTRPRV